MTATAQRWRLILGKYAQNALQQASLDAEQLRLERSLDYLYNREYERRGDVSEGNQRHGTLDDSQITAVNWLNQAKDLFPKSTFERVQQHAIERYQLDGLLQNADVLQQLEPTPQLAKTLLTLRGRMDAETRDAVRGIIQKVVDEIIAKIKPSFTQALIGRKNRFRRSLIANSQNFDWKNTIRQNLKHYQAEQGKIIIRQALFYSRQKRHLPWTVVLCVDQSASMMDSVMYSAVCASILASLPTVDVKLLVFDTQVVNLSHLVDNPVEVLLTVQLGGGTDIAKAVAVAEQMIEQPHRTVFVLISDFEEGGSVLHLLAGIRRLHEKKVKLLGLGALDAQANSVYDIQMAQRLTEQGMQIACLTPEHFAEWLAEVMQ